MVFTVLGEVRSPGPGLRGIALVWRVYLAKAVEENFKRAGHGQISTLKMKRSRDGVQLVECGLPSQH